MAGTPDSSGGETQTATTILPATADVVEPPDTAEPPDTVDPKPGTTSGTASGRRRPRALTVLAGLAIVLFALWGIGTPLLGSSTLTATNEMVAGSPWVNDGFAGIQSTNTYLDDTYTSELPSTILFKNALSQGQLAEWNPYGSGGYPLAALPDYAFFSPLTVPYYVLPTWLAPAYERLLEIVVAVGGSFLFLRRLSLSRAAALTGGLVYATSGFMVAWLGFPQTRVAAFIPVLFWAVERFIQLRRLRDAVFVAVPVGAMLLGGFPSVTGYALLTAGGYVLVRLIGIHRHEPLRLIRPILYLIGAVIAGVGLTLFQLIPFLGFFDTWLIQGRGQDSTSHLALSSLLTTIAPWAFGSVNPALGTQFTLLPNFVEATSYISAAGAVLVLVAVAMPRQGRALLPRGVWFFLLIAGLIWAELIYLGGPPLAFVEGAPGLRALFSINFIGRARSILGFLLAILVAVGLELLIRHRTVKAESLRGRRIWAACIIVSGALLLGSVIWLGWRDTITGANSLAEDVDQAMSEYKHELVVAGILVAVAVLCVLLLRFAGAPTSSYRDAKRKRWVRFGSAAVLIGLITAQSTQYVVLYYPHSPPGAFFPSSDTHRYLAANLGDERYASSTDGMVFGTNTAYQLRSVNGHAFINTNFAALVNGIPDGPIPYPTYIDFQPGDPNQATSPVLDVLGTKYWVAAPADPVFGTLNNATANGTMVLAQNKPVTIPLTTTGPLRAVQFTATGKIPTSMSDLTNNAWVTVVVRDTSGRQLAKTTRLTAGITADQPFQLAVTGEAIPPGTQETATFTLHGPAPLTVDSQDNLPSVGTITDYPDGLRVVFSGSTVIYQRLNALPRIRWASQSKVMRSQGQRVATVSAGDLPADTVILAKPGPVAAGKPGTVHVTDDGIDSITTKVDAQGAGYLVIADADQVGWTASVDGRAAPLVSADEGLVAVPVPAGQHTVRIQYSLSHGRSAVVLSIGTAVVLVLLALGDWAWFRYRRRKVLTDA